MANPNNPSGLVPVETINGAAWTGKSNRYWIAQSDVNAFYVGDVVVSVAGSADGQQNGIQVNGVPQVTKAGLLSNPRGVIVSIEQDFNNPAPVGIPATKTRGYFVHVADDPMLVCRIQGDNTTTLSNTVINQYADLNIAAPAAGNGVSATQLATATITSVGSLPFRIYGIATGDFTSNTQFLVVFNFHELG